LVLSGAKNEYKSSVYNPCLPGGSSVEFTSAIHFDKQGVESWETLDYNVDLSKSYTATLKNDNSVGDFEKCSEIVKNLLAKDQNSWCNFAHHGDCSVSHVYQPRLPLQQDNFGEFFAFTNFYKVWVSSFNLSSLSLSWNQELNMQFKCMYFRIFWNYPHDHRYKLYKLPLELFAR
jgi:hypothetical protein